MAALTPLLLQNFPFEKYTDNKTMARGLELFTQNHVIDVEFYSGQSVLCAVEDNNSVYSVEMEVDPKTGGLVFSCDCSRSPNSACKHMIAAAMEVREQLVNGVDEDFDMDVIDIPVPPSLPQKTSDWKNRLNEIFSLWPGGPRTGAGPQRYAIVLLLTKQSHYYQASYEILPAVIKAKTWSALQNFKPGDTAAVNDLLATNFDWLPYQEDLYTQLNPAGCLNLSEESVNLLNFFQQTGRYYSGASYSTSYLPMLARIKIPAFLLNSSGKTIQKRLEILSEPVDVEVLFTREGGSLVLRAALISPAFKPGQGGVEVISMKPPWLLIDNLIFPLRDPNQLTSLTLFPLTIPEKETEEFRKTYLRRIAETFPIRGELIQWQEVQVDPIPRLYLHEDKEALLLADLRFSYGEHEVAAAKATPENSIDITPDSWNLLRIHRQPEREESFYQLLTDPVYRLKRADATKPYGTFALRARAHPFDFLLHAIPLLTRAGFEIFGEEKLKLGKINRATPSVHVSITSGIDWFDLKATVGFGDQEVSFHDVHKALKRGENYVKLADGSVGQIPDEWLEKYKHLWNLTEETEEGFRVSDFHLPLIDTLLEGDATIQLPSDLTARRERFRAFEKISPHPLPSGFTGELRPYQKHGFDWLHFLREYKFGGILADDMGLGKTVQVLAYLESLREQGELTGAALLVVPKSLITNWQRESEKFTPGLRFLEYMGNLRSKDTSLFNQYDIILTTYGTMLRDIEFLREYRFHHVILDESQAIKNPLAKSAKAARLINADQRIVMTGTPVENNTFELWSQFAFLNPGLLGTMEYFKREFANPIESGQGEPAAQAAATLRALVYPFILRRTKDQVAPELPPRTERILYTDMDTPQKKLYSQTRERYRSELLGLIENEGMEDVRFKILEGLLRLRQIAIHPALVDKSYKGEAPKFELLLETLETLQAENHKALIFSQFVETLKLVRQELDARKIAYVYLDGQTNNRQAEVDRFQNDPAMRFFLISLKAGGVGLNLTAADYVIHLDPWWNPAVEMQASDRAHRIGQDKPVFVYKIIARDTVEEKILLLQEKKRDLVKNLISSETSFFKSLTRDDVKMLFE